MSLCLVFYKKYGSQFVELIIFAVIVEDPMVYSIDCVIADDLIFPVFTLMFPYA